MVLIVGAGAVGTILAAHLCAARTPVALLLRDKDRAAFDQAGELRVDRSGGGAPLIAEKPAAMTSLDLANVEYLFICVKFPALDALLDSLPSPLPPHVTLVSTLNGVQAIQRIRERFPGSKVASMTVLFNGQLLGTLHAQITTRAKVLIGSADGKLLGLFGDSGMKVLPAQGDSAVWGKLLINLANAVCALTHATIKDLFTRPDLRAIYTAVLDEATAVMEKAGIQYHLPVPGSYGLFRFNLLHGGPLPWWLARLRNGVQEGAYFSMVADVEAGRKTEVDQLNGEILRLGRQHGLATPVNEKIVGLIQQAEGQLPARYRSPAELRSMLGV